MNSIVSPAAHQAIRSAALESFTQRFIDYVQNKDFPCVGARSAINSGRAHFGLYQGFGTALCADALRADLHRFSASYPSPGLKPVTFIAMFDDEISAEAQFESRMWQQLQEVDARDSEEFDWDPSVSSDPTQDNFSFSVGGRAFFVVGLSPVSSRLARRAPMPCLVFNFHDQFEALRRSGLYARMQTAIRARDQALQGSINPVLSNFGSASEARQYSGRNLPADWRCPFHHRRTSHD